MIDQMVRDKEKKNGQGHAYAKGHNKPKAEPTSDTDDGGIGGSCCTPPDGNGGPDTKP